ncbi:hypothetical protein SteCoe_12043 [Stentor coeruleus]|uniref:Uncharacterized protein n=1 Tax=Stentor coeruleus TaxID=5963 RepID=A0A1R2CBV4_9CILI|nr:hypothetical protein SteCoe_12043 [Stentor coeruleus]
MGCIPTRKSDINKPRVVTPALTSQYLNTIDQKLLSSIRNQTDFNVKCRRFKIPEPEGKIFKVDIKSLFDSVIFGSADHGNEMEVILNDYKDFISSQSFFFSNVHSVCVSNFGLEKGLIIMITVLIANKLKVEADPECPYLKIIGNQEPVIELINSWNGYSRILENLHQKYERNKFCKGLLVKTSVIIRRYENLDEQNAKKRIKYLKEIKNFSVGFFDLLKEMMQRVILFADFFNKNKDIIVQIGQTAETVKLCTCEKMVHSCYIEGTDQGLTHINN